MSEQPQNWSEYKSAILEGLDEKTSGIVGQLMEQTHHENVKTRDQINTVVQEDASAGDTGQGSISRYDTMFMPLIRRTMPALLATDLVGVQPINSPRGIVRTLRFRYSNEVDTSSSDSTDVVSANEEASGVSVHQKYSKLVEGDAYDAVDGLDPYEQALYLESENPNDMNLEVVTKSSEPMSRKLSATYTLEASDDLQTLDGLDIESELTQSVGDEVLRELDRELLENLNDLAGTPDSLDFKNIDGRYAGEKLAALNIQMDSLSDQIATATKRSGATWMVVSPKTFTGMKHASNDSFVPASNAYTPSTSLYVGTFGANISVYVDPYASSDYVLLGYKGSEVDTGFIYAPYIPLQSSGVVTIPENGDHRIMMRTRYSLYSFTDKDQSLGNSADFYKRANIANLALGFKNA